MSFNQAINVLNREKSTTYINYFQTILKTTFFLFWWLIPICLFGQNQLYSDSLESHLNTYSGIDKIEYYLQFCKENAANNNKKEVTKLIETGLNHLEQIDTISKLYFNIYAAQFISIQNWNCFELKNLICAFKGSLKLDSISHELLKLNEQYDGNRFLADASTLRGAIFVDQKHFVKAENEFLIALEFYKKLNDPKRLGWGYMNLAILNGKLENYEKSEFIFHKSDSLFNSIKNEINIFNNQRELGKMYLNWGKYEAAETNLQKAVLYAEKEKMDLQFQVKGDLAKTFFKMKKDKEAERLIKEAHALLDEIDSPDEKKENLEIWAYVLEKNGETDKALEIQKEIKDLEKRLTELSYAEELVELQTNYINRTIGKKKSENKQLLLLFLFFTATGIMVFFFRNKQKIETIGKNTLEIAITQETKTIEYQDTFLEKFLSKVTSNIANENLTIEILAEEMGFSRSQLFNKVKAATGDSPSSIIRKARLETAAQILKNEKITVSEVAYRVGFANPKSFSRAFKEKFGVSPSDFS